MACTGECCKSVQRDHRFNTPLPILVRGTLPPTPCRWPFTCIYCGGHRSSNSTSHLLLSAGQAAVRAGRLRDEPPGDVCADVRSKRCRGGRGGTLTTLMLSLYCGFQRMGAAGTPGLSAAMSGGSPFKAAGWWLSLLRRVGYLLSAVPQHPVFDPPCSPSNISMGQCPTNCQRNQVCCCKAIGEMVLVHRCSDWQSLICIVRDRCDRSVPLCRTPASPRRASASGQTGAASAHPAWTAIRTRMSTTLRSLIGEHQKCSSAVPK